MLQCFVYSISIMGALKISERIDRQNDDLDRGEQGMKEDFTGIFGTFQVFLAFLWHISMVLCLLL